MKRIAINGFGRIGRAVFRIASQRKDLQIVAVNDITENKTLAHLLRYDSVMGIFQSPIEVHTDSMTVDGNEVSMLTERDPQKLAWGEKQIDVVVESTGVFRSKAQIQSHIDAGAKKVLLTVPPKDEVDSTIVLGVNDDLMKPEHLLVSNASCTTNCLAPIAKIFEDHFGIEYGFISTVHAYTNDQNLVDTPHSDYRRARAAAVNIIPTSTGAAKAIGTIIPSLQGKLDGNAIRVPVVNGSLVDFVCKVKTPVDIESVNRLIQEQANQKYKGIVQYTEDQIVSTDILGNPHSSIFDASFTNVIEGSLVKCLMWYDNEWGYSNRVVDLLEKM
ncbi:MAG: type I glyceraldehyde-3-phosphate dehydrogenase [Bdellovibrionales bacterium]|nr:type I glyceraldehyde-3-phosphate dehydrogenase [Bdellovibrionales bacterium]